MSLKRYSFVRQDRSFIVAHPAAFGNVLAARPPQCYNQGIPGRIQSAGDCESFSGGEENMEKVAAFLRRKDVILSAHRYGIDAMGAMAQGLFASLLIGTILKTLGQQTGVAFLVSAGEYAAAVAGPAMAASIGWALHCPPLVLFSLIAVGGAANSLGGAGGPAVSSGMGTCGLVGQIGVYTGWADAVAAGTKAAITGWDWAGLVLICFVLPALLTLLFAQPLRRRGWIREGDLKLN